MMAGKRQSLASFNCPDTGREPEKVAIVISYRGKSRLVGGSPIRDTPADAAMPDDAPDNGWRFTHAVSVGTWSWLMVRRDGAIVEGAGFRSLAAATADAAQYGFRPV